MVGAKVTCDLVRRGTLIRRWVVEAERERTKRSVLPRGEGGYQARIDASGQQHAQRDVADQLSPHRVLEQLAELIAIDLLAPIRLLRGGAVPVGKLAQSARPHLQRVRRRKAADSMNKGERLGDGE